MFTLYYCKALVLKDRWEHPRKGFCSAQIFILLDFLKSGSTFAACCTQQLSPQIINNWPPLSYTHSPVSKTQAESYYWVSGHVHVYFLEDTSEWFVLWRECCIAVQWQCKCISLIWCHYAVIGMCTSTFHQASSLRCLSLSAVYTIILQGLRFQCPLSAVWIRHTYTDTQMHAHTHTHTNKLHTHCIYTLGGVNGMIHKWHKLRTQTHKPTHTGVFTSISGRTLDPDICLTHPPCLSPMITGWGCHTPHSLFKYALPFLFY